MSFNPGGGSGSSVQLSGNQTVDGVKTFTSAPVVPSGAFPQSAVANLSNDLASTFRYVIEVGGSYPNRPAFSGVVVFIGADQPANTGTTAGGTPAAVPGLDRWWTA